MLLHTLVEAGCHFGPDDLSMREWFALAQLKGALEQDAEEASRQKGQSSGPPTLSVVHPGER
jgi:hypothetical protein